MTQNALARASVEVGTLVDEPPVRLSESQRKRLCVVLNFASYLAHSTLDPMFPWASFLLAILFDKYLPTPDRLCVLVVLSRTSQSVRNAALALQAQGGAVLPAHVAGGGPNQFRRLRVPLAAYSGVLVLTSTLVPEFL